MTLGNGVRAGCAQAVRASTFALLALVACAAGGVILLLVAAFGVVQLGPGGVMSDVRVGTTAPDFDLPTLDGGRAKLSDYRGRPVALNFWATWCVRCEEELPALAEAAAEHAADGLVVIAVNPGQPRRHVERQLADLGVDLPVAFDVGKAVWRAYRIVALPTTVWIDRGGVVRAVEIDILTPELIDRYVRDLGEFGEGPQGGG